MSVKDLPFVTVEQVVILRQAAIELEQRAEAAEAKLIGLEMQEPAAWVTDWEGSRTLSFSHPRIGAISKPLYAKPFPAPKQEEK